MSINSITGPSLLGIQRGLNGLSRVATEVASGDQAKRIEPIDFSRAMVEMKQYEAQVKISSKALKYADQALGTLLDERA